MIIRINPVIRHKVRRLCKRAYPGHPDGCPNYNIKEGCPPSAPFFEDIFLMRKPFFAAINEFNLERHRNKLKAKHPLWTLRQLNCCLYWQNGARKKLQEKVNRLLLKMGKDYAASFCPEAMGIDVTATLKQAGIKLEWPVNILARQVAIVGKLKDKDYIKGWR